MTSIKEFVSVYEKFAPKKLIMGGDPTGLHFGHPDQEITKVMTTLDVRPEVVDEAVARGVDFILAHHPPIFKPAKNLVEDDPQNHMYAQLIRHNIGVYASHTNLDVVAGGMNDWLADALDLTNLQILSPTYQADQYKLVVYVPQEASDQVLSACHDKGAGQVGDFYQDVSTSIPALGRFTPKAGAKPAIGQVDQAEEVQEDRLEVLVDEDDLDQVISALLEAHPYEEPVYDVFKLEGACKSQGIGRVGDLSQVMTLEDLLAHIKKSFDLQGLRYVQVPNTKLKTFQKIAICGGDGSSFIQDAINSGADAYITGDVYYHTAHDLQAAGLTVIDPGHHTEAICIPKLAQKVQEWIQAYNWPIQVVQSQVNTEPFEFYTK